MGNADTDKPSIGRLGSMRRKAVNMSPESLIKTGYLHPGQTLPLVVEPAADDVNLISWAASNQEWIQRQLLDHGGILFRGFGITTPQELEAFISASSNAELLEYTYRSTPRSQVSGNIYTSTEYPADQSIPMHNEMSYARSWPLKIWFCCVLAAQQGGETPIADSRKVLAAIDPAIRAAFAERQVMYVRNYGQGLDLSWESVFQTSDKQAVEDFCRQAGIEFAWLAGNRLRTRQVCQGVATYPITGEQVWFNQAHLFHVTSLLPEVRAALLAQFDETELPRNTYYGDGVPIEPEVLDHIRAAFDSATISFPWQAGDVVLLDNMLVAHSRAPFAGPRKVIVGMAEQYEVEP